MSRIANAETESGLDDLDVAEDLFASEAHALQMTGLKLAAVTDGEFAASLFARIDHLLALLD